MSIHMLLLITRCISSRCPDQTISQALTNVYFRHSDRRLSLCTLSCAMFRKSFVVKSNTNMRNSDRYAFIFLVNSLIGVLKVDRSRILYFPISNYLFVCIYMYTCMHKVYMYLCRCDGPVMRACVYEVMCVCLWLHICNLPLDCTMKALELRNLAGVIFTTG